MKRMINLGVVKRALSSSYEMAAESLIEIVKERMKGRISEEEAHRLAFRLGEATMTLVLQRQLKIKEMYN